jgi:hypothetical protein
MTGATPESGKSLAPRICAQEFLRSQLLLANRLICKRVVIPSGV